MKKLLFPLIIVVAALTSCNNTDEQKEMTEAPKTDSVAKMEFFGDTIAADNAIAVNELEAKFQGKDSLAIKLSGKITDVCQKKGCWMELDMGNNKTIRITFKDYAFFVPKDATGKTAVVDGYAYTDTVSVAQLKHYAHDAGKSKAEIEAIKEPEISTSFEARGVIIQK
jgi:hypothetical protein